MIFEAANADTKNALQVEPLAFKSSDKAFRKSQFRNQSKYQLRRWIWRRTRLEVEVRRLVAVRVSPVVWDCAVADPVEALRVLGKTQPEAPRTRDRQ